MDCCMAGLCTHSFSFCASVLIVLSVTSVMNSVYIQTVEVLKHRKSHGFEMAWQ